MVPLQTSTICYNQSEGDYYSGGGGHALAGGSYILKRCIVAFKGFPDFPYHEVSSIAATQIL